MRAFKLLGLVLGGLLALLAIAVAAILLLVDPNDFKDRIAQAAERATGRTLQIRGDIQLKLFPQLALNLGEASLGNPAGFGDAPFATVKRVSLGVAVLPLLHRELDIGRIEIDGLDLRLVKDAEGHGNWQDFGQKPTAGAATTGEGGLKSLELEGLRVTNGRVQYGTLVAEGIGMEIGRVAPGQPFPVQFAVDLRPSADAKPLHASGRFSMTADLAAKHFTLAELTADGTLQPLSAPQALSWRLALPSLDVDLASQTLTDTAFEAALGKAQVSGRIHGTALLDAPALQAQVVLKPLSLRELMGQLGIKPPVTRDAQVLSQLSGQGDVAWHEGVIQVSRLKASLDGMQASGAFALDMASGRKDFELSLDHLEVDRYLPPPPAVEKGKEPTFELPHDSVRTLEARGTLAIGSLKVNGLQLANMRVGLLAHGGLARFSPVNASLYGGQYKGDITVDARSSTPMLRVDQTMAGIDIAAVLQDFMKTKRLSGRGTVTAALTAQGHHGDDLVKSLNGRVQADITGGAVEGIDLTYAITQAQSLLQRRQLAGVANAKRTTFNRFHASADIAAGIATTRDLAISSDLLRVAGQGSTNLATQALDYRVSTTLLKAPPQGEADVAGLMLLDIPVDISGTLTDPKVRPDLGGIAKARLKQEVEKRKEDVKGRLQDALKGLLGR